MLLLRFAVVYGLVCLLGGPWLPAWGAAPPRYEALARPAVLTPTARSAAMLAVARAGDRLVAVGERGVVLLSDDHGQQWRQAPTPVRVSLTAVQFVDAQQGWAVGHLGVVLHTRDGGQSWAKQLDGVQAAALFLSAAQAMPASPEQQAALGYAQMLHDDGPDKPLLNLYFRDGLHGVVVGAYNLALQTADGGASWQPLSPQLPNPRRLHLYAVAPSEQGWLIAGEQGLILRPDGSGPRYATLASPYKGSWFGMLPAGQGGWLFYGLRGSVYRSSDGGTRWDKADTAVQSSITAGQRLRDGTLLLSTQTGDLLQSADDGRSWRVRTSAVPAAIAGLTQAGNAALIFATLRGPWQGAGATKTTP